MRELSVHNQASRTKPYIVDLGDLCFKNKFRPHDKFGVVLTPEGGRVGKVKQGECVLKATNYAKPQLA